MRDIKALHPFVQMLATQLVINCKKQGLNVKITDCVRTKAEQDDCIRRGTSSVTWLNSFHAWGLAFDICQNDTTCAYPSDNNWWTKVGVEGEKLGLTWGGRWTGKSYDRPHFQLDLFDTCVSLTYRYTTPANFFNSAAYKVTTPKLPIDIMSSWKKVAWLQVKLNCKGYHCAIDGEYGEQTISCVKAWYGIETGKNCTGKLVSVRCINLLDK